MFHYSTTEQKNVVRVGVVGFGLVDVLVQTFFSSTFYFLPYTGITLDRLLPWLSQHSPDEPMHFLPFLQLGIVCLPLFLLSSYSLTLHYLVTIHWTKLVGNVGMKLECEWAAGEIDNSKHWKHLSRKGRPDQSSTQHNVSQYGKGATSSRIS